MAEADHDADADADAGEGGPRDGAPPQLSVLGGFRFWDDETALVTLSSGSQRLMAFLALRGQSISREQTAGTLYPNATDRHAYASLRSTLSRLDAPAREAVLVSATDLGLADDVAVDLREAQALAHRILSRATTLTDDDLDERAVHTLSAELLPGWYDDWVMVEAEDWRQLRLHALEALAERLVAAERFGDAAAAALAAVRAEPLRETARAALIRVHLAEGNQSEAIREFDRYRVLLLSEIGLEPTDRLRRQLEHPEG